MDHPAGLKNSGNNKVNGGELNAIFLAGPVHPLP
jgi:hypothetical protein